MGLCCSNRLQSFRLDQPFNFGISNINNAPPFTAASAKACYDQCFSTTQMPSGLLNTISGQTASSSCTFVTFTYNSDNSVQCTMNAGYVAATYVFPGIVPIALIDPIVPSSLPADSPSSPSVSININNTSPSTSSSSSSSSPIIPVDMSDTAPSQSSSNSGSNDNKIGLYAGISVAIIVFIILAVFAAVVFFNRQRTMESEKDTNKSQAIYYITDLSRTFEEGPFTKHWIPSVPLFSSISSSSGNVTEPCQTLNELQQPFMTSLSAAPSPSLSLTRGTDFSEEDDGMTCIGEGLGHGLSSVPSLSLSLSSSSNTVENRKSVVSKNVGETDHSRIFNRDEHLVGDELLAIQEAMRVLQERFNELWGSGNTGTEQRRVDGLPLYET